MLGHGRGAAPSRSSRAGESGETLIEVMAAVILLGVGIAAILGGIMTLTVTARQNRDQTKASLAMQLAAETIQGPSTAYVGCALPGTYTVNLPANSTGASAGEAYDDYRVTVQDVDYLNRTKGPFVPPTGFDGNGLPEMDEDPDYSTNCFLNPNADRFVSGLQRVTLQVERRNPANPSSWIVVDTAVLFKRTRYCPETFNNADAGPC